jgi:23S rRNA (pseudouridine1915-N3)-methyltransferase
LRILLIAVGRLKSGPAKTLYDEYARRSGWPIEIREVAERRSLAADALKAAESEKLLAQLPARAEADCRIVALDEAGENLSSAAFAARLKSWRDEGIGTVVFLIGGADGLAPSVRARAHLSLALGRMTWPHQLVRGLLAEQIYRAQSILAGHPYHRS